MTRIVKIKNIDTVARTWAGQIVSPGAYYTVSDSDLNIWSNSSVLLVDIADGYAIVNDGSIDITDVNTAINWLKGIVTEKRTKDGRLIAALTKPDYSELKIFSHNFADKTTWYPDSVRDLGEQLIRISNNRFVSDHRYWIDLTHGKVTQEDSILSIFDYRPIIYVYNADNELLDGYTEKDPHTLEGEFKIDYFSGEVIFDDNAIPDGYIVADYNYATTSNMYINPDPGKQLDLLRAEVQFTTDVVIKDSIIFETYVYSSVIEASMGLPTGTLGPAGSRYTTQQTSVYKSASDFIAEANGSYPICPAFGGTSWRGIRHPTVTLPFDYYANNSLKSSLGTQIQVYLEHHDPHEGTYGTVTFYCNSRDE